MSRRDTYHDIVKYALINEGWKITHDPYLFQSEPELSTDLGAERTIAAERSGQKIAVEIKSFLHASQITEFEKAIGQYELYSWLLQEQEPDRELFVAVPTYAYHGILSQPVGQMALKKLGMKLIVYAISEGGTLQWITP